MFYICARKEGKYGVKDTKDGVTEFYALDYIQSLPSLGIDVAGLTESGKAYVLTKDLAKLWYTEMGVPVRVRLSKSLDWKQTLFCRHYENDGQLIFQFYDDSGITGTFGLSSAFVCRSSDVSFDFNNNEPEEVAHLIMLLKKGAK